MGINRGKGNPNPYSWIMFWSALWCESTRIETLNLNSSDKHSTFGHAMLYSIIFSPNVFPWLLLLLLVFWSLGPSRCCCCCCCSFDYVPLVTDGNPVSSLLISFPLSLSFSLSRSLLHILFHWTLSQQSRSLIDSSYGWPLNC